VKEVIPRGSLAIANAQFVVGGRYIYFSVKSHFVLFASCFGLFFKKVSFLHVYHHISIAWAWWFAIKHWPTGDAYFGALLNSWIHVMMYSYYALSLLKFPCPWKRYITQAQLLQFATVVVYTACSAVIVHRTGEAEWGHYACYVVQTFEMVSFLYLFSLFYSKAYKKRKQMKRASDESEVPEQSSVSSDSSESSSGESKKEL
jgi:elongation of very long chain fatty acids protein 4